MMQLVAVGLGGFLGAVLRYGASRLVAERFDGSLPLATLVVNVVGCLAIGAVWGWSEGEHELSEPVRLFLTVGLLGGLTTFSTFGFETVSLLRDGEHGTAFASLALNLFLGLGGVVLGRLLGRLL